MQHHDTCQYIVWDMSIFKYFGTLIKADGKCSQKVKSRIAHEKAVSTC